MTDADLILKLAKSLKSANAAAVATEQAISDLFDLAPLTALGCGDDNGNYWAAMRAQNGAAFAARALANALCTEAALMCGRYDDLLDEEN